MLAAVTGKFVFIVFVALTNLAIGFALAGLLGRGPFARRRSLESHSESSVD